MDEFGEGTWGSDEYLWDLASCGFDLLADLEVPLFEASKELVSVLIKLPCELFDLSDDGDKGLMPLQFGECLHHSPSHCSFSHHFHLDNNMIILIMNA